MTIRWKAPQRWWGVREPSSGDVSNHVLPWPGPSAGMDHGEIRPMLWISCCVWHYMLESAINPLSLSQVFLAEYIGPLFIYLLFFFRLPNIYLTQHDYTPSPHSVVKYEDKLYLNLSMFLEDLRWSVSLLCYHCRLACMCHSLHYIKRLAETIFIHRFSHGTMALKTIAKVRSCHPSAHGCFVGQW